MAAVIVGAAVFAVVAAVAVTAYAVFLSAVHLGDVFVAAIVVLAVLFVTGYYNLTAVELIAFLLIFSWLIVFLRNAGASEPRDARADET